MNNIRAFGALKEIVGDEFIDNKLVEVKGQIAGVICPKRIDKAWGHELIHRNDLYCMKTLYIKSGYSSSQHFHISKHETLLVVSGELTVEFIKDKSLESVILYPGQALAVCPGFVHQLCAKNGDVELIESSMTSFDDDSIRIG